MGGLGVCGFTVGLFMCVCFGLFLGCLWGGLFSECGSGFVLSFSLLVVDFRLFPVPVLLLTSDSVVVCSKVSHSSPLFQ